MSSSFIASHLIYNYLTNKSLNNDIKNKGAKWNLVSPLPQEPEATEEVRSAWNSLRLTNSKASRIEPMSLRTNIDAFGGLALGSKNVGVHDDVWLERPQDKSNPYRDLLAHVYGDAVGDYLKRKGCFGASLGGTDPNLEAVLHVRVIAASEGSYMARYWDPIFTRGHTKLGLLWCLQSVRSRRVVAGGRVFSHKHGYTIFDAEDPDLLLKRSSKKLFKQIKKEVDACLAQSRISGVKPTSPPTAFQQKEITPDWQEPVSQFPAPALPKDSNIFAPNSANKDEQPIKAENPVNDVEPVDDVEPVVYFPELQQKMTKNKMKAWKFENVVDSLVRNEHDVKKLTFGFAFGGKIGDAGAIHVAKALKSNTIVEILDISDNNIGDEGAAHIADAISKNTTLKKVDLSLNHISDEGAKHLGRAIAQNRSIVYLNLGWNHIDDDGAVALADGLLPNSTLKSLTLRTNGDIKKTTLKRIKDELQHRS